MEANKQDFWLTYIADLHFEQIIRKGHAEVFAALSPLSIANYSKNMLFLTVILSAVSSDTCLEKERAVFRRKSKELEIYVDMDKEKLNLCKNDKEVSALIAETYLNGIKPFLQKKKNFQTKLFLQDVENLFLEKGLLG